MTGRAATGPRDGAAPSAPEATGAEPPTPSEADATGRGQRDRSAPSGTEATGAPSPTPSEADPTDRGQRDRSAPSAAEATDAPPQKPGKPWLSGGKGSPRLPTTRASAPTWSPGAALVVPVDPSIAADFVLPSEASPIVEGGAPALHVTLLSRAALAPIAEALAPRWGDVLAGLPDPPPIRLDGPLRRAHDAARNRASWYVPVADPEAWRAYTADVSAAIDAALRAADAPGISTDEPQRVFHVTLANDQGGDPYGSIGRPWDFVRPV